MSETPGSPEYYTPPSEPTPVPPPAPLIGDAAQQWTLQQEGAEPATPPQYGYAPPPYAHVPVPAPRGAQGLAITALVLGIVGLVTGWIPGWGVFIGVAAIIFGAIALAKRQSKGMAIPGIVMGVVSIIFSAIVIVFIVIGANTIADDPDSWFSYGPSGGETTLGPESVDGGLAVAETAMGVTEWDAETTWFVVILENPSDMPYVSSEITVNALDASGAVVDTYWTYQTLPSGESALTGAFYDLNGAEVDSLEVVGPSADALATEPATGGLDISGLTATTDDYFTTVSGTATSSFTETAEGATIIMVARDAGGTIIGAATGWLDPLDPGATATFDAMFYEVMPEGTAYEAYWTTY